VRAALRALVERLMRMAAAVPRLYARLADLAVALVPPAERERAGDALLALLHEALRDDPRAARAYREARGADV
jgi:hypothetical protein